MRAACLAVAAAIVLALFLAGGAPAAGPLVPAPWDKLAHLSLFAALTLLLWVGIDGRLPAAIAATVLAVGMLDELHQAFLPGRSADLADLLADACGIAVALLLLHGKKLAPKGTP